ncbi:MAG TPA: DinB family protein [Puia sp.]
MIKTFFLGFVLFSLSVRAQTDSLFANAAILKMKHSKEYTIKVAQLMPVSKYGYKASPEEMSFEQQLLHVVKGMQSLCKDYLGGGPNTIQVPDSNLDKDETIKVLNTVYDYAINSLENFKPNQLSDTVSFFIKPMNKLRIINLMNDHQTHHRAQLVVYLRMNGIKPPDYVGW